MTGRQGAFTISTLYTQGGGGFGNAGKIDLPGSNHGQAYTLRVDSIYFSSLLVCILIISGVLLVCWSGKVKQLLKEIGKAPSAGRN